MMIEVSEASGAVLDWMVGKAVGLPAYYFDEKGRCAQFSTNWSKGGPIIEREGVGIRRRIDGDDDHMWLGDDGLRQCTGPTPLVAAMRCYVVGKLGHTVEVPEELTP